jgi:putative oxidoreductase
MNTNLSHIPAASSPIPLIGRILYAAIFLMAAPGHFSSQTINYAASQGVPLANIAVPISGILALVGGLSVLLGYKTKIGAWLLILFLIPVTAMMHQFWAVKDPMAAQMQQVMFMKNIALVGAGLFLAYFGPGPLSVDNRSGETAHSGRLQATY